MLILVHVSNRPEQSTDTTRLVHNRRTAVKNIKLKKYWAASGNSVKSTGKTRQKIVETAGSKTNWQQTTSGNK